MGSILFDGRASQGFWRSGNQFVNGTDVYAINQTVIENTAAIAIAQDPLDQHGQVWRMTLDATVDYDAFEDKARAEITTPNSGSNSAGPPRDNSGTYMAQGVDLWMRWAFLIPADFVFAVEATEHSKDVVIIQIHDAPGTAMRVAPWHLVLVNDDLQLRTSWSETVDNDRLIWRDKCRTDHWYEVALNAQWDSSDPAGGYMRVWVGQREIFREYNALNTYATYNSPGPYPKGGGYYYPHGIPSNLTQNSVYHRGVQIGTAYVSLTEFLAACGSTDIELEPELLRLGALG